MVNRRFQRVAAKMGRKEYLQYFQQMNKSRPESMKLPEEAMTLPGDAVAPKDLPFGPGDRVQIQRGPHRHKVGQILFRYPDTNAFGVDGVAPRKMVNTMETKRQVSADDFEPVSDSPATFALDNLRLVSRLRQDDGSERDVVIHSVSLGAERYNPLSNRHERVRFATHDPALEVPWPAAKPQAIAEEDRRTLVTAPEVADTRTHYVMSAVDAPLPLAAVPQITNLDNRFKRARYAAPITAEDVARHAKEMPATPATRRLLAELAAMPKPQHAAFSAEMEAFISAEVKKGLEKRVSEEAKAAETYA